MDKLFWLALWAKSKAGISYFCSSLFIFFLPIKPLLIAVGVAIFLDTVFGVARTLKLNGWKSFTSRKLSRLASKMLLYQMVLISLFVIDFHVLHDIGMHIFNIPYVSTKAAALTLIYIELKSIKENFELIYNVNLWKMLKELLMRTKEIKGDVEEIIGKDEKKINN
ncbi:phage holin family protein [Flavobacterium qiangtangense]|uniref:Phage holin family protein n=1 Tax=Flavobacterium qiangtangense TaxID=1442595 RepID=A0ABW1PJR1_9FLAO